MSAPVIAVEGLDGVGKTTLCTTLPGFEAMATPGARLRDARRAMHDLADGNQLALQLFYAASVCAVGRRARDIGRPVAIDRYWLSTVAYGLARGSGVELAEVAAAAPAVDITVVLQLDEAERQARLLARADLTAADRETFIPAFRARVVANMKARYGLRVVGQVIEIDTTGLNPTQVATDVLARVARVRSSRG